MNRDVRPLSLLGLLRRIIPSGNFEDSVLMKGQAKVGWPVTFTSDLRVPEDWPEDCRPEDWSKCADGGVR